MICPPTAITIFTKPVTYLLKLTSCTKSFILFIKFLHIFYQNKRGINRWSAFLFICELFPDSRDRKR